MRVTHTRIQHGVGQGSFHSASVVCFDYSGNEHRFDYVYDCGAVTSWGRPTPQLVSAITNLRKRLSASKHAVKPLIDALVISHYDQDHLNGAQQLIKECGVKRIFLPYLSHDELILLVARSPELTTEYLRLLQGLASGVERLFEVPITMIRTEELPPLSSTDRKPQPPLQDLASIGEELNQMPRVRLNQEINLGLPSESTLALWRLKFWNIDCNHEIVKTVSELLVQRGFPIQSLMDQNATENVIDWLAISANRMGAIEAYRFAFENMAQETTGNLSKKGLPNAISLCLYSGPPMPKNPDTLYKYACGLGRQNKLKDTWTIVPCSKSSIYPLHVGWLGTGDAPLGENNVWSSFLHHYHADLNECITVQIPHHGAAPQKGPKSFNPGLFPHRCMNAVISFGYKNRYGHPASAVVNGISSVGAYRRNVTNFPCTCFWESIAVDYY